MVEKPHFAIKEHISDPTRQQIWLLNHSLTQFLPTFNKNCWLVCWDVLRYSQNMPWINRAIGENYLGGANAISTVALVGLGHGLRQLFGTDVVEVCALLHVVAVGENKEVAKQCIDAWEGLKQRWTWRVHFGYQQGQETDFDIGSPYIENLRQWKASEWLVGRIGALVESEFSASLVDPLSSW